ncbi:hypothetical protein [Serratia quinivorans]|uniref:hypothetical protein n=1 Tax=Serratia quinivorans TaxID=137545 RepID=UPI00217B99BB|nr:hypothetical protein [Serratia quinivorans]CAI0787047.1 Uncharacterised protein [Serratia quinivorans]CAI1735477.1 Uncharacterised protein [Serratia quinivorans]
MRYLPEIYQEWGRDVIGGKLCNVNGLVYIYEAPDLDHPQQLQLIFSGINREVSFQCGKDGATLVLTELPMQESDLGEYGKEVIMNMSDSCLFYRCIGRIVGKVFAIYSDTENTIVGIKLFFDSGIDLIIINLGDELNVFNSLPLQYVQEECINYLEITP